MSQREHLPKSDQSLGAPDPETPDTTLRRGTLGLLGIVFFVVAAAAPLAGMTGAFPVAVGIGNGAGAAGMYVAVGIILLFFSVGYANMSHYVTNTGAFFAYVGRGLGIVPGVGSAMVSLLAYLAVQWCVIGFLGFQLSMQMEIKFGIAIDWWIYALALIVIVWVLSALSVDVGAKILGVFLTIELLALLIVGLAAIFNGGPRARTSCPPSARRRSSPVAWRAVRASRSRSRLRLSSASRQRPSTARSPRTPSAPCRRRPTSRSS